MSQWKPIETAPKDGTEILVYYIPGGIYELLAWWWNEREERWHWADGDFREWETFDYWQPLPPPPEAKP